MYILQIIIQKIIRKVDEDFESDLDFKHIKFPVKIKDIHKLKKNCIGISVFGYENKEKYPIYVLQNTFTRYVDLLLIRKKVKRHIFLSTILIHSCMIIHYIMEENLFLLLMFTSF